MESVVGIFINVRAAKQAIKDLQAIGIANWNINLLTPGASAHELQAVPKDEGEQPGMGQALGAVVGTGLGTAGGAYLGMAAATAVVSGVGPVIAIGLVASGLMGIAGALSGAAAGDALENALSVGLPKDEWFLYEDALRQGRTILVILTEDDPQADSVRAILSRHGAEGIDSARERWWIGLRSAEEEHYAATGESFRSIEPTFRRGFEAALHPEIRGQSYDRAIEYLQRRYPSEYKEKSFRFGFERGQHYWKIKEKPTSTAH
ncbi:MAG TPA: hypothetical protein VGR30_02805 [Candidatus Binatia bacterium]|nr:hypothetical protein [Candidatus Binatia bacterium]